VAGCRTHFTVMPVSMGMTGGAEGDAPARARAHQAIPSRGCLDSAAPGSRKAVGSLFGGVRPPFREESCMRRVIPQVAALLGPCAAGTAYIPPALADFVRMSGARLFPSPGPTFVSQRRIAITSP